MHRLKCLLLVAAVSLSAFTELVWAGEPGKPIRVAVYEKTPDQEKGILDALRLDKALRPESVSDLSSETLAKFDVLILSWTGKSAMSALPEKDPDWQDRVRQWVRDGHGLLATHTFVGYRTMKPFLPEVAVGTGNPFDNRLPYDKELCAAREHPVSAGFAPRDRFPLAYFDYVTLSPGPEGVVVFRGVERAGDYASSSAAAVVCGEVGKGRYVACGAMIGHAAPSSDTVQPVGGEAKMLLNAVRYLSGQGKTKQGEDIGGGFFLGPAKPDYANNGSLESGTTDGWKLLDGSAKAKLEIVKDAKEGKNALSVVLTAPGKATLANIKPGTSGEPGQIVYPDSGYALRVWTRAIGAKSVSFRPALLVWKAGAAADAAPELFPAENTFVVGEAWTLQEAFLIPPDGTARVAVALMLEDAQAGEGLALDGLIVNRKDTKGLQGVSTTMLRARCEIPLAATWTDASKDRALAMTRTPEYTPIVYPQKQLTLPKYNRWHEDWKVINLGGSWKLMKLEGTKENPVDDAGTRDGYWKSDFDDAAWPSHPVPAAWSSDPDGRVDWGRVKPFAGVGWYRHAFDVPADFAGKRIILRFANISQIVTPYVNGQKLRTENSFNMACEFDVTDVVKPGDRNLLAVRLFDPGPIYYQIVNGGILDEVTLQARPPVHLKKALITRYPETSSIEVDLTVANSAATPVTAPLTAKVSPSAASLHLGLTGGKEQSFDLGEKTFAPGESTCSVTIKLDKPVEWLPENPYLYEIRFAAGGMPLGKERFGMSLFSTKENLFLLNGKPTRLRGMILRGSNSTACYPAIEIENRNQAMNKIMLAYKDLGMEVFLPQGPSAVYSEYFRYLCDELGMMIFEYPGTELETLATKEFMRPWLEKRYNHPAYIMTTIGCETRQPKFLDVLNRGYDTLKELDKQKRVICTITGGDPAAVAPRTDVEDFHIYPGEISGHPLDMQDLIEDYNERVWRYHGKIMPVINFEMGGMRCVVDPQEVMSIRTLLLEKPVGYKQALIDQIEGADAGYSMIPNARWLSIYGMRRYAIDDYEKAVTRGYIDNTYTVNRGKGTATTFASRLAGLELYRMMWCVKGMMEQNRLLGDLFEGYGFNYNLATAHLMRARDANGKEQIVPPRPVNLIDNDLVTNLAYDTFKRVINPVFICAAPFNTHPISGKTMRVGIYAINDLRRDAGPWAVRVVVKSPSDRVVLNQKTELAKIPSLKRAVFDWTWDIPAGQVGGFHKLELFLMDKSGQVLSDNEYSFYVVNSETDLAPAIDVKGKRVALYDAGEKTLPPGSITTAQALEQLKFPCQRITDFDKLDSYDVLLIGRNSADAAVDKAGDKIRTWIEGGRSLVQFEQASPGKISFAPQLNIVKSYGGAVADMIVLEHPIFDGLRHADLWDTWSGRVPEATISGKQGGIYSCLIGPLNRSVLASASLGVPRASNKIVQMLVSEVKIGKGRALITQAEATRRFQEDGVATRYLENVLRHAVDGDARFAESITGLDIKNLDIHRFGYLDINDLKKAKKQVAADWKAKFTAPAGAPEFGNIVFKNITDDAVEVTKEAPLLLEFDKRSTLMYPEWEAEKLKQDVNQRGLMPRNAEAIYLLYCVSGGVQNGDKIGTITFRYADGSSSDEKLQVGYNIGLPDDKGELEYGRAAGEGYFLARWTNPNQDKEIVSMRVEITNPKAKVLISGISNYLMRQKVHD